MHIVFDARIHLNHITGISRYIINLLKHLLLIDKINDYTVLINSTLSSDDILIKSISEFTNVKFKIIDLPHFGPLNYFRMSPIIKSLKPDIYYYPHIDAPIVKGIPTISTIHDTNFRKNIKKYNDRFGIKTLYFKYTLRNTLTKSRFVTFDSEAVKQEIEELCPQIDSKKYQIVYAAIESDFANIYPDQISLTKLKYNLPDNFFLFVGQLREHKNIDRIIQAFNSLNQDSHKLILIGNMYNNSIRINYPNIQHLGMVDDSELKCCYALSSCFLFPSLLEGFGLPILEAMSFGIPVITSNFGSTKEVAGNAGILVDPYSVEDIAEKMQLVLDKNYDVEDIKAKGFAKVAGYSWETSAIKMLEIYKSAYSRFS